MCLRACVRACVRGCVRACVRVSLIGRSRIAIILAEDLYVFGRRTLIYSSLMSLSASVILPYLHVSMCQCTQETARDTPDDV